MDNRPAADVLEAARRLGITPDSVRARLRRRTLEGFRDNAGRWWVYLPGGTSQSSTDIAQGINVVSADTTRGGRVVSADRMADLMTETAALREKLAAAEQRLMDAESHAAARLTDRDRQVADLQAERDRLRADHAAEIARLTSIIERRDREAERMQVLLQAEQQQVKALTDQRHHPPDPPKPRWRRWFSR